MLPIEKYIDAIENKDYEGLGSLFTKDGHYCDYCANGTAQHDYHLYGREAISMFFRNKFLCRQYSILEPTVLSPSQAEFIACFGGYHVMAIVTLQQLSADGHIRRLTAGQTVFLRFSLSDFDQFLQMLAHHIKMLFQGFCACCLIVGHKRFVNVPVRLA